MFKIASVLVLLFCTGVLGAQSPHGSDFREDCLQCHESNSWDIAAGIPDSMQFDHDQTGFMLKGGHLSIKCKACHPTLIFAKAKTKTECVDCHTDIHQQTVGNDCSRCHTPSSWIVDQIPEIHEMNGFALVGAHDNADCKQCHLSENDLRFDRIGNDCINCHQQDYAQTQSPNHELGNISKECQNCHNPLERGWVTDVVNHDFFPLTEGHDIQDCQRCHTTGNYADASPECVSCHQANYDQTDSPNHQLAGFPTDCSVCHGRAAWLPANFDHNQYYTFNGAHIPIANNCDACHNGNYTNTPNTCVGCHQEDYNNTSNPDHEAADFPTDCASCHSEDAWTPASFDHNAIHPLKGAHATIANDCAACHSGGYVNTPNTCVGCHQEDYNNTSNPNHGAAQFPIDCEQCHNENTWAGATFDHDGQYFPIFSGKHNGRWNQCSECHTIANDYSQFNCLDCHNNASYLANKHDEEGGYVYQSSACYSCHPDGSE